MKNINEIYKQEQSHVDIERQENLENLKELSTAWKNDEIPLKQRRVVQHQLENLKNGQVDPVFVALVDTLNHLPFDEFSILDAACASGYYFDVISTLVKKKIRYVGSDFSPGMIELAKKSYPDQHFYVEDLTDLSYHDKEFDIVLVSGVLEHVPNFVAAISEVCRVAKTSVILHRCLVNNSDKNIYTSGYLYNIKTPRIFFSKEMLKEEFEKHGYTLELEISAYQDESKFIASIKNSLKRILLGRRERAEFTLTFTRKAK